MRHRVIRLTARSIQDAEGRVSPWKVRLWELFNGAGKAETFGGFFIATSDPSGISAKRG